MENLTQRWTQPESFFRKNHVTFFDFPERAGVFFSQKHHFNLFHATGFFL